MFSSENLPALTSVFIAEFLAIFFNNTNYIVYSVGINLSLYSDFLEALSTLENFDRIYLVV